MKMARNTSDPRRLLDQNRDELVSYMLYIVAPIVDWMFENNFLTRQQKNEILGAQVEDDKARRLLDVVRSKGLDEFLCFREALRRNYPDLQELLRHCATHNAQLMFWCEFEECECLLCEKCKSEHAFVHPQHVITAIFSINEEIRTDFDRFIRESRAILNALSCKQISSKEQRQHKIWAETIGGKFRTLVSRTIKQEIAWVLAKLRNQRTASVIAEEPTDTGKFKESVQSDEATDGQHTVQLRHENAGDLRTLLRFNWGQFVSDMQFINPIVDVLYQEGIIEFEEKCRILLKPSTPQDQARRLLDVIWCKCTIEAILYFTKALETTYPHLAELLHQCPVHNSKFVLYCENCKVLICESCWDSQHRDHFTTSTTTVTTMCKSEFDRFILDNREGIMDIRQQKMCPEELEKRVKERGSNLCDVVSGKIDEEVDMFVSKLDQGSSNFTLSLGDTSEGKGKVKNFKKIAKIAVMTGFSTMLILFAYFRIT